MSFVITAACVDVMDKSCLEQCPVDCIYAGDRQLYIHPDECIDCGACEPVCPESAIFYQDEVPESDADAAVRQQELFAPLPELGGAKRNPPLGMDHPYVSALPPLRQTPA